MKALRSRILILLILPLFSFTAAHKFYVSVTNVDYSEKDESLQIISRLFIDDVENLLETRYQLRAGLATDAESDQADALLERYFRTKFTVTVNGVEQEYKFLGKRYDRDLLVCYLEVPGLPAGELQSVALRNEILCDLFEEQKNLVHFNVLGKKQSVVLIRENSEGMLNL